MEDFFKKLKVGCLNDHFDLLGGGTVHSFKFLEYLKKYYDIDVYVPNTPKTKEWMKTFLHLDIEGLTFHRYAKGVGKKYNYMFLNISHWRAEETNAFNKYMLVFFPQFFFPLYGYEFLANSKYTKSQIIKRWKQPAEKIHVVYPPIMTSQFKPGKKTNSIVHVSRITPPAPEADKGHKQMIQAFKDICDKGLKGWEFHIIGQVQDVNYCSELKDLASGYPIQIHEGIPFSHLKKLYSEAKIYWHLTGISLPEEPGAQEHFGMTTIEAMSSGCVPITLATGGQLEVVEDGIDGFLVKDVRELKKHTLELVRRPQTLKKMAKEAIKRSKDFDEEITKKRFYSIVTKTDKVSIIILCWNNSKYTKECVERLYEVTPPGFELILVDNASTDNTKEVFEELTQKYKDIKCVFNKTNLGFAKGNNTGLKKATRPYICYLNNDTLPQWGWLEGMMKVLEINPKAGVVGARLYFPKHQTRGWIVQHAGITLESGEPKHIDGRREESNSRKAGIEEIEATTGACMLARKPLAEFNKQFIRGYYEDGDLCLRAREKGYKVYINHEVQLIHYEGVSQSIAKTIDKIKFTEINLRNKALFHKLWDKKMKKLPKISKIIDMAGTSKEQNIEIGGGENSLYPSYAQVDLRKLPGVKYQNDARLLPFASDSLSNICSCYMLQCLSKEEAMQALKEWHRCLKPGGKLELHIPDLDKVTRMFISTQDENLLKEIYGEQRHELDYYQYGWTFQTIDRLLTRANFVRVLHTENPKNKPYALSVIAYKPK